MSRFLPGRHFRGIGRPDDEARFLLPCGVRRGGGGAPQSGVTEGASARSNLERRDRTIRRRAPSVTAFGCASSPAADTAGEENSGYARAALSVVIAFAGLSLAACSHSDPTRFFTLDPVAPARPVAATPSAAPMRLRRVTIPPALDRVELTREIAPGEVKVSDFEHWAAPLGLTAVQVLAQDLAERLPAGALIPPAAALPTGGVDVDVDILAFNVADGQAVMQVSWSEIRRPSPPSKGGQPPSRPSTPQLVELTAPVDASGGLGEAQGFSRLLGQLADRIAAAR